MSFGAILLLGVGVSADAFAVGVCKGLSLKKFSTKFALIIALFFGGFQAIMTFLGWALASQFSHILESIDHWVAFILLAILGGKMLYESFQTEENCGCQKHDVKIDLREMLMLSIATSIDALAVGISLAFAGIAIFIPTITIGITTFLFSFLAVIIGFKFGSIFQKYAEMAGGIILILIGVKILLDHTVFIA
ncbi:MAG: manganese efflux pump MntP family protein [Miniphocaeibacter sp.]|uniref:manganese efflux pump MntP n=1 Tax=Miniphocaeibacter sp. TaxID=3100973 RepID=UPI0017D8DD23|nr:manganese efflux pump [Gallicola sp.]